MKLHKIIFGIFFFFFLGFFSIELSGQGDSSYKSAVGARFGSPYISASYKTFLNEKNAMEAYASFRAFSGYSWISVSGAYQIHKPLQDVVEGLQWYYGAGASAYFWTFDTGFLGNTSSTSFGINGYIGLDYKFPNQPVAITVDWVPTLFLNGFGRGLGSGYGGVGVRYILK